MSLSPAKKLEFTTLLHAMREGMATTDECRRVHQLLVGDKELQPLYFDHVSIAVALRWTLQANDHVQQEATAGQSTFQPARPAASSVVLTRWPKIAWLTQPRTLAIAVSSGLTVYFLLVCLSLAVQRNWWLAGPQQAERDVLGAPAAWVTRLSDCRWASPPPSLREGSSLPSGHLRLASGILEARTAKGATIRFEGPCTFELQSASLTILHLGQLVAQVPDQAIGFSITTPTAKIVDLGTEFGVTVDEDGTTDVHVLAGLVEMQPKAGGKLPIATRLSAGNARRVRAPDASETPVVEAILFNAARYTAIVPRKPPDRSLRDRNRKWNEFLKRHPALVAHYPMNEPAGSTIALDTTMPSENGDYRDGMMPGGVKLCAEGARPPAFPAFEATNTAAQFDGVRLNGGTGFDPNATDNLEITSLKTLDDAAYSFEVWFNCRNMSELQYLGGRGGVGGTNPYDAVGLNGGDLAFFNGDVVKFAGSPHVTPNTWHHLVYSRQGAAVKVYLDGELRISGKFEIRYDTSDRIVAGYRPDQQYGFAGLLDELAIYNTALTAEEVRWHYQVSRP